MPKNQTQVNEVPFEDDADALFADETQQQVTFDVLDFEDFEGVLDAVNRPALAEGTYLAVASAFETYVKPGKNSLSYNTTFLVNTDPNATVGGWAEGDKFMRLTRQWLYAGKIEDGRVNSNVPGTQLFIQTMANLGHVSGRLVMEDMKYRVLLITIVHESYKRDDGSVGWNAKIKSTRPFLNAAGERGERLPVSWFSDNSTPSIDNF